MQTQSHITFVIAKQLLEDKRAEALNRLKPSNNSKKLEREIEAVKREIKAIEDELWLLNNW